jgi:hypothetical protein
MSNEHLEIVTRRGTGTHGPGAKLPACPPRRSAPHPRPQLGAERACDAPAVKSRLHFCPLRYHLMLVNLKVASMRPNLALTASESVTKRRRTQLESNLGMPWEGLDLGRVLMALGPS